MERGTILHSMLLGTPCKIEWIDHDDYRTNAAKIARDTARLNEKIPLKRSEQADYIACVNAVKTQLVDLDVSLTGQAEGVALWIERDNQDRVVYCKLRADLFDGLVITDLKSTTDAHPDACLRRIIDGGYDIQAAVYLDAIGRLMPDMAGRLQFRNVFFEVEPPYLVNVVTQGESLLTIGRQKWTRAINLWSKCLHSNRWPAYGASRLDAPAWAIAKEMEAV